MLLEAAMADLHSGDDPTLVSVPDDHEIQSPSPSNSPPQAAGNAKKYQIVVKNRINNSMPAEDSQCHSRNSHIVSPHDNDEGSLFKDDHSKEGSSDEFSSSNAGSSFSTSFCDDSSNEGVSLLQDDNEFVSKVLNREPSNLGESSRFGSYRSTMAAGAVAFQWEAEPGKCKNPTTIQEEEEEQVAPLSLPPIRLAAAHMLPHKSPSSSATQSPRSLTGKVKNLLINHVKKPSIDHFSFSSILETQKSPSKKSPHRAKKGRRTSSLSESGHASLTSSPCNNYASNLIRHGTNMQRNEELYAPRASLNSSDHSSSPYYFSPLSNASSYMSHGIVSPRMSIAQSVSRGTASITHPQSAMCASHAPSPGSDSSISSISSAVNAPTKASSMLANCLLTITSISNDNALISNSVSENGNHDHQNCKYPLSFASPEMEVVDEGLSTSTNYKMANINKRETSMADFINRGGPSINRSFSVSRVTFADDLYRRPSEKSKYYSAQLNNLAQPKGSNVSPIKDSITYSPNLDVLFPLKRPYASGNLPPKFANRSDESPDDRQAYVDALDTSLDCSVLTDNEELNSMVQSIMNNQPTKERPAQEVVMRTNDENDFAYSPVASAFVFSHRKTSQNAAKHYFKPSTRVNIGADLHASINGGIKGEHHNALNHGNMGQPKSILKKPVSHELCRTQSLSAKGAVEHRAPYMQQSKSLSHTGSQKISSVLLRFAEAEEQLYNSKKHHQHQNGMRSPACIQPVCSFLGRALLCRSKLAGRLHS